MLTHSQSCPVTATADATSWPSTVRALSALLLLGVGMPAMVTGQGEGSLAPSWDSYHSTADAYAMLRGWAQTYPGLTNLYSIGETLNGTPLLVLEITNESTGQAADKPGYYYDGNIHAEELTGAEVVLHFAWYVLTRYGRDPRVTRLLDTRTLYIRPKFNPDGADIALTTPQAPRSTPRPYDEDGDGRLDEDPPNDLDGDGAITQMRVANPGGRWKKDPRDGRLMQPREDGELSGEFYDVLSEGIDDDGDLEYNEDGVGGIDMNRNFPRNWGLEFEQPGAGPYPLSEPETRATIEFMHTHRNITGVFHGHTAGGFLYRLPSTTSWDDFSLSDQNLIVELAAWYNETTGQLVIPSFSNPRLHRHGTLISWAYWDFGVVGFVPEFWGGFGRDYDGDGDVTDIEQLRWSDEELDGTGFADWAPRDHPVLGRVEIGGWRLRFTRRNPPPHLLRGEIEGYVPWMLRLAEASPRIVIRDHRVEEIADHVVAVSVTVENEGYLPTNITQRALAAELAVPVRASLELHDAEIVVAPPTTVLGHLAGSRDRGDRLATSQRVVTYVVRITGSRPLVSVTVRSEKGGVARRQLIPPPS